MVGGHWSARRRESLGGDPWKLAPTLCDSERNMGDSDTAASGAPGSRTSVKRQGPRQPLHTGSDDPAARCLGVSAPLPPLPYFTQMIFCNGDNSHTVFNATDCSCHTRTHTHSHPPMPHSLSSPIEPTCCSPGLNGSIFGGSSRDCQRWDSRG